MTHVELLKETIEYYENNPRGLDEETGRCSYRTKDGSMCAVGRCIADFDLLYEVANDFDAIQSLNAFVDLDKVLKPEYHNIHLDFWKILQTLHDNEKNWEFLIKGNRLSKVGRTYVMDIRKKAIEFDNQN